jgi:hypothetical protein
MLRSEFNQIGTDYREGQISRKIANARATNAFSKALSKNGRVTNGLRFQREFSRGVYLDFMREDISRIVNNALSGNRTNWHGFYRELKFINYLQSPGSPFELIQAGTRQKISDGRLVEFDMLVRHKRTGSKMVIESKDWGIRTRADLEKAKDQIAKIAQRTREEGVSKAVWMNRQNVPEGFRDDLVRFGKSQSVSIYDNVSTGQSAVRLGKAQHVKALLKAESTLLTRSALKQAARVGAIFGVVMESGFAVHKTWQWQSGGATTRDLVTTAGGAGGAIAGAAGGAATGAAIGSVFPGPGTAIGGFVGGFVGGFAGHFAGSKGTEYAVEKLYFENQTAKEREATVEALIARYTSMAGTP